MPRAEPPHTGAGAAVRVVYIMGAGRSGSTLLGIMLGNGAGAFYAGELDAWIRRRGIPNGDTPGLAAFWEPIGTRLAAWTEGPDPRFFDTFEHPRALIAGAARRRRDRAAYRRYNRELYAAIADAAGGAAVVDSSHFPLRRWNLRGVEGVEVFTVMLVRDPRTVVSAFQKPVQKPKGSMGAVGYVWVVHALSCLVYLATPRRARMRVRYEDLVRRPGEVLGQIGARLGVDVAGVDPDHLVPGPVFQGNRMRTDEVVRVRPGGERPERCGALASILVAPWVLGFGYRR
jgi:hypothetical protein